MAERHGRAQPEQITGHDLTLPTLPDAAMEGYRHLLTTQYVLRATILSLLWLTAADARHAMAAPPQSARHVAEAPPPVSAAPPASSGTPLPARGTYRIIGDAAS